MDINERLKKLKRDEYFKLAITHDLAKSLQNYPKIKLFLRSEILNILKEIYEPLGMWKQNPNEKMRKDFGVIIDGEWSPIMQADTNYTGYFLIFNRCNQFLVNLYRKKGIESIEIDGTIFSYKNLIVFDEKDNEQELLNKLETILKIVRYKKNEIFLYGCEMYDILIKKFIELMDRGSKAEKFYENDIYHFFPNITEYKFTKGRGDYDDRNEGIDVWKTHDGYVTTDQVKSIGEYEKQDDGYFINVVISQWSKCDYFVFVKIDKLILIFKNDRNKITFTKNGVIFSNELLYKQKNYE